MSCFLSFFACTNGDNSVGSNSETRSPASTEPGAYDNDDPSDNSDSGEDANAGETPGDISNPENPPVAKIKSIARLFYNGNVVDLKEDYSLESYGCAENYCISACKRAELIDGVLTLGNKQITDNAVKAKKLFVHDDNIYLTDLSGNVWEYSESYPNPRNWKAQRYVIYQDAFANDVGYSDTINFYFWDGRVILASFFMELGDILMQQKTIANNLIEISVLDKKDFVKIGTIISPVFYKTDFIKSDNGCFYGTRGPILDLNGVNTKFPKLVGYVPKVNPGTFVNGNDYLKYFNPPLRNTDEVNYDYHKLIGKRNNIAYLIDGRTGELSKFNMKLNSEIRCDFIQGCNIQDADKNIKLYEQTGAFMINEFIYYSDGTNILRYNIETSVKEIIAEGVNFKAWKI